MASMVRVANGAGLKSVMAGALLALSLSVAGLADEIIVQTLNAGTRTVSVTGPTLTAADYSHTSQNSNGFITLTVDDSSASNLGWNVTIQSSDLAYTGSFGGSSIPAASVLLGTPAAPEHESGQDIDETHGPLAGSGGTLDAPRTVIYAQAGYGKGEYTQTLPVTLTIPGMTLAGTYTATLTVDITAGP